MEIREEHRNGATVVQLLGRLDELATMEAETAFSALVRPERPKVVLDMSGVEYISSSGLRILLMLSRALQEARGVLVLCGLSPFVAEVFEISNFSSIFDIRESVEAAVAGF